MVLDHWSNDAMVSMDRCGLKETYFCQENVISGQIDLLGNEKEMLLKDWYVMIKQSEAFLS